MAKRRLKLHVRIPNTAHRGMRGAGKYTTPP